MFLIPTNNVVTKHASHCDDSQSDKTKKTKTKKKHNSRRSLLVLCCVLGFLVSSFLIPLVCFDACRVCITAVFVLSLWSSSSSSSSSSSQGSVSLTIRLSFRRNKHTNERTNEPENNRRRVRTKRTKGSKREERKERQETKPTRSLSLPLPQNPRQQLQQPGRRSRHQQ